MQQIKTNTEKTHSIKKQLSILFLIALFASLIVYFHLSIRVKTIGKDYRFEQEWLVNAISVACGQGFTTPVAPYPENIRLFLEQKTNSMQKTDLPKNWDRWNNSPFVKTHRYLLTSIGFFWRIFGIKWSVLKIYAGILFVITVLASYWTVYRFAGKTLALLTCFLIINAPSLLYLLPSLRDYSKTTFFMLFLALIAELLFALRKSIPKLFVLSTLLGLIIGIGIGFRQDVLILFLPGSIFIVTICIYHFLENKKYIILTPIILYTLAFLISGYPILKAIGEEKGAVSSHSIFQGLSTGVENESLGGLAPYRIVYDPNDMLVHSTIVSYARRHNFGEPFEMYLSPAYGKAGRMLFKSILWYFPADLWGRVLSACGNTFTTLYCFDKIQKNIHPEFNNNPQLFSITEYLVCWDKFIAYIGPWALLIIIFAQGCKNPWKGIIFTLFLGYILSYPSLLFEYRHIVHLTPILYAIVILAFSEIFQSFFAVVKNWRKKTLHSEFIAKNVLYGTVTILFVLISCIALYGILWLWQKTQVNKLLCSYYELSWEPIKTTVIDNGAHALISPSLPLPAFEKAKNLPPMETPSEFMRLDFELQPQVSVTSRYDPTFQSIDFSESFDPLIYACTSDSQNISHISIFFSLYPASTIKPRKEVIFNNQEPIQWIRANWLGIEIPKEHISSFQGLYRARNPEASSLLLTAAMPKDCHLKKLQKQWRFPWNPKNVQYNIQSLKKYGIQDY